MTDPRCGTTAGYQAHTDAKTTTCQPCRDAQATWQRHYRTRMYFAGGPMLIDAAGTRRRLHALNRMGWRFDDIGDRLGVSAPAVRGWATNATVRRNTAARVADLYDELWDRSGPSQKTAARAKTKGWLPPLAWDDDKIDDPLAQPSRMTSRRPTFDEVAVQRAMHGNDVHLRPTERAEAVRRLTERGMSAVEIAARLGVEARSVSRHRAALRQATEEAAS